MRNSLCAILAFFAFWVAVLVWSLYFIFVNGKLYVRWPKLVPVEFAPKLKGDDTTAIESGNGTSYERSVKRSAPRSFGDAFAMLLERWAPSRGGDEKVEVVKDEKVHAE